MLEVKFNQIILYIIIIIFGIGFLFYFYREGAVGGIDIEEMKVGKESGGILTENFDVNLDLFKSEKFKKLRDVGLPALKFEIGKRNPFESYR